MSRGERADRGECKPLNFISPDLAVGDKASSAHLRRSLHGD
jgi:hypothetical protein